MALTTQPFVLSNLTLTLKKTKNPDGSVATGTAVAYRCQLNTASLTPSAASATTQTYETFCATFESGGGGSATWVLNLAGFQAYKDVTDLSIILFNDERAEYQFVLSPEGGTISATNPGFQGTVKIVPTVIGGTANQYASFTVDLPCTAKPTMLVAPPVLFDVEE